MMVQMTSIIDDYVRSSDFGDYGIQESSVALITFVGANPSLSVRRFVVNVDSNDLSSPKKTLPHSQRSAACARVAVPANSDFEKSESFPAKWGKVSLIVLRVPMRPPFVASESGCKPREITRISTLYHRCDGSGSRPFTAPAGRWKTSMLRGS